MTVVGTVESVWRYPVKSMAGENLAEAFIGYAGVYGDRRFAFHNATADVGFPFFTARERHEMVRYQPRSRGAASSLKPLNQAEAESRGPGLTPIYHDAEALELDVVTPTGEVLAIDDPTLISMLTEGVAGARLSLLRSDRALTDCRPLSLISLQTIRQIGVEAAAPLDKRRFRANIYAELGASAGFAENDFVGRRLQIGGRAVVAFTERDSRCKMITIDPDTAQDNPVIGRTVARQHGGDAGIYGAVLTEGMVRPGDPIVLLN